VKGDDINIRDPRRSLVMLDFVLLLVQLPGSKKIVDGLIVLRKLSR
jgi:hypothetical protein